MDEARPTNDLLVAAGSFARQHRLTSRSGSGRPAAARRHPRSPGSHRILSACFRPPRASRERCVRTIQRISRRLLPRRSLAIHNVHLSVVPPVIARHERLHHLLGRAPGR